MYRFGKWTSVKKKKKKGHQRTTMFVHWRTKKDEDIKGTYSILSKQTKRNGNSICFYTKQIKKERKRKKEPKNVHVYQVAGGHG